MQNYISTDSLVGYEYLGQSLYTFLLFINKNKIKNKFYKRILRYLKAFTFYQNRWKKKSIIHDYQMYWETTPLFVFAMVNNGTNT